MYYPHGFWPQELGDIDVIEHEGTLHLFHLTLPAHDVVAHATSTDGISWTPAPAALRTGDPGECDDDMIWTMNTVRKPDGSGFRMYYTACSLREHGHVQRVAMAESADLIKWSKHPGNPILESRAPYYNDDFSLVGFISFRDPYVFIEDGTWHMLVTARAAEGNRFRRGCIAHATSRDGMNWELRPPLYAPQSTEDLEVPAVQKIDGRYYLFYNILSIGHTPYRIADSLEGPWHAPEHDIVLPAPNSCFRFCRFQGKLLAFHWLFSTADWQKRAGSEYKALMPPKEVRVQPDGTLALASFDGWKTYYNGQATTIHPSGFTERSEPDDVWREKNNYLTAHVNGIATARVGELFDDFALDCEVQLTEGHACGIVLRSDDAFENFVLIRLDYAYGVVELHRYSFYDSSVNRYKLRQPTLWQSAPAKLRRGKSTKLYIIACREYIEVSIDGAVRISAVTYQTKTGRVGFWVDEGSASLSSLTVQPLRQPKEHGY